MKKKTTKAAPDSVVASNSLFDRCTETKKMKDGSLEIHCKRGLWSVCCQDHSLVKQEAMAYFALYYRDGEYDWMLSNNG